jgi:hypothetical protein
MMLSYTTIDHRKIEIDAYNQDGRALRCGRIDGKSEPDTEIILLVSAPNDVVAKLGRIDLSRSRYLAVRAIQSALQAIIDADAAAACSREELIKRRRDLILTIEYAEADARATLAVFDLQHPEVSGWSDEEED